MSVGFKPPESERRPRLEHVRHLWQMHRPHRPQHVLTGALFRTDTGYELRIGFSDTNLVHSELSRTGHAPLILRDDDLRQVLLEQGWIELIAPSTKQ